MPNPSDILGGKPVQDTKEYIARLRELQRSYEINTEEKCHKWALVALTVLDKKYRMPWQITPELTQLMQDLFLENCVCIPEIPDNITGNYAKILASIFSDTQHVDRASAAFADMFAYLTPILPEIAFHVLWDGDTPRFDKTAPRILLGDLLDPRKLLNVIMHTLSPVSGVDGYATFFVLNEDIKKGFYAASGYTPETYKGQKLKGVADITDAQAREILRATPFHKLFSAELAFTIPDKFWKEHCFIAAPTGHGKTQTLQHTILQFLQRPDPPPMFIIDSMGSMLKLIQRKFGHLADRIVVLDPTAAQPPQLNFFKMQGTQSLYFYLFKAIDQTLTQRQATMIAYLIALMQQIEDSTLDTLRELCESKGPMHLDAVAKLSPIEQDFFNKQFHGNDNLVRQTKQQIAQRLYTVGRMGTFNAMFNAKENEFDAYKCIQGKKIVLVNTDAHNLDEASPVFGRFVIAQCLAAARKRADIPADQRHLALLIVDEAKAYMDETTERILSDARQFGLGLVQATQHLDQLPDGVRKAVFGNTTIKYAGPVSYADAMSLSRDMRCDAAFMQNMRSYDRSHTEWACYVRNFTDRAIKLSVPMGAMESFGDAQSLPKEASHGETRIPSDGDTSIIPLPDETNVIITPPPPKPSPAAAQASPRFIPGVGQHVHVYVGKDGIAFYSHGATITRLDITAGRAWVDPRPHAKQGDPDHCFEEPKTSVAFSELGPFEPATKPPQKEAPPLSDIELVITVSQRIEGYLETHCGAVGKGLHEKLSSAEARLPPILLHRGRNIASMRNKTVHQAHFKFTPDDRKWFITCATSFDDYFSKLTDPATNPPHPKPERTPKNQNTRDPHTDYDTDH